MGAVTKMGCQAVLKKAQTAPAVKPERLCVYERGSRPEGRLAAHAP